MIHQRPHRFDSSGISRFLILRSKYTKTFIHADNQHQPPPPLLSTTWAFSQLSGGGDDNLEHSFEPTGRLTDDHFQKQFKRLSSRMHTDAISEDDWVCLNNQGVSSPFQKFIGPFSGIVISASLFFILPLLVALYMFKHFSRKFSVKAKMD
mmetsp:Transcript_2606/g.3478  ORF Transcript_2606/g.3478 Transcript_2606/m.3478 type:complete len:151 (+) Transcript_2606:234-686(+)